MKIFSSATAAALSAGALGIADLLALEFSPAPVYLNSSNWDITYAGKTYKGAAGLGQITPVQDQPGQVTGLSLSISGTSPAVLSLAMDAAGTVKGTPVALRTAIFAIDSGDGTITLADAPLLWAGKLDTMALSLDGNTRTVGATAESQAINLMRSNAWYYSSAEQRLVNPTDGSMDSILSQLNQKIIWPSRQWFINHR